MNDEEISLASELNTDLDRELDADQTAGPETIMERVLRNWYYNRTSELTHVLEIWQAGCPTAVDIWNSNVRETSTGGRAITKNLLPFHELVEAFGLEQFGGDDYRHTPVVLVTPFDLIGAALGDAAIDGLVEKMGQRDDALCTTAT